ncbi:hypothetical protein FRB99_003811 [Tulasnella sp. 403]|nr:hypothetical protein FRB99_003811 [Tulasnella sp. 403]
MADVDSPCVSVLDTSEIVGLAFIAESGVISSVAVIIFALLVLRNFVENRRKPGPNGVQPLIRTHVDAYMISLMFADLLQGLGAVTSAKWAADGRVVCSAYCTAQGALQQLGETGVALSTLAITVHTFATVFFRWQPPRKPWLWMSVLTFIWTFLILFVALGYALHKGNEKLPDGKPYFGPTPFWCWIGPSFLWERIVGEYFWLWFCAMINILLYPFLFFTLRGNIDVDPSNWRRIRFHRRSHDTIFGALPNSDASRRTLKQDSESVKNLKARNKEAMKMFWYPISYTVLVLPLSITRWSTFRSREDDDKPVKDMSIVTTSVVLFIFGLSGLCNVLLFLLTRPNLLLFNVRRENKRLQRQSFMTSGISFSNNFASPRSGLVQRRRTPQGGTLDGEWPLDDQEEYIEHAGSLYNYPPAPMDTAPVPPTDDGSVGRSYPNAVEKLEMNYTGTYRHDSMPPFAQYGKTSTSPDVVDDLEYQRSRRRRSETTSAEEEDTDTKTTSRRSVPPPPQGIAVTRFQEHFYESKESLGRTGERRPPPLMVERRAEVVPAVDPSPETSLSPVAFRSANSQSPDQSLGWDRRYSGARRPRMEDVDAEDEREDDGSGATPSSSEGSSRSRRREGEGGHVPPPPLPAPLHPVYSPSRASPRTAITSPPAGYPSNEMTRARVEEWALRAEEERMRASAAVGLPFDRPP